MPLSYLLLLFSLSFFFFNDTAPTEIYPLSLHDALPILVPQGVHDSLRPIGLRKEIDAQTAAREGVRRSRPDRDERRVEVGETAAPILQPAGEGLHAVGAGEDHQSEPVQPGDRLIDRRPGVRRLDSDGGGQEDLGALLPQEVGEGAGLIAGSGDQNPTTPKRERARVAGAHRSHPFRPERARSPEAPASS